MAQGLKRGQMSGTVLEKAGVKQDFLISQKDRTCCILDTSYGNHHHVCRKTSSKKQYQGIEEENH